jgi:hypothetical protein
MICHTCSVRTFGDSAIVLRNPSVDFFTASCPRFSSARAETGSFCYEIRTSLFLDDFLIDRVRRCLVAWQLQPRGTLLRGVFKPTSTNVAYQKF